MYVQPQYNNVLIFPIVSSQLWMNITGLSLQYIFFPFFFIMRSITSLIFKILKFIIVLLNLSVHTQESTKDAVVIGFAERPGQGGLQVYEFEYEVDSTRGGMKRIFSAAFVASKKLYLVNITHSDKPESPLNSNTRIMLEQVLHSFDAAPLT